MDKAEYKIKLDEINACAENGDISGAVRTADTIDWRRVKSVRTLCMISEIYEASRRYEDGMEILRYAYKRSPQSKTVLYRLTESSLRAGKLNDAKKYYAEFEQAAPHDTSRYILKYKLLRAEKAPLDEQIAVLKEYKEREYTEKWAYELAKLYKKNGQKQRCIEECDDMILWFAEGRYVTRAMELKMQLTPLSESQKAKYEARLAAAKEAAEREEQLREEMEQAVDSAQDGEEEAPGSAAQDGEAAGDAGDTPSTVTTAEVIEKMNAAADAQIHGARYESRMPNVRPAVRQSISGRNAGGNDMQDQLASSIRAVFSGIRSQSEDAWEEPQPSVTRKDLLKADDEAVLQADGEDAELAELFAETENAIAQTVLEATADDGRVPSGQDAFEKDINKESTEPAAAESSQEETGETEEPVFEEVFTGETVLDVSELSEDDMNVTFVEKDGVFEIVAAKDAGAADESPAAALYPAEEDPHTEESPADEETDHSETDSLTGRETDESLGLTREFNFKEELALARAREEAAAKQSQNAERSPARRIPDPEEAAVKIVAESGIAIKPQETPEPSAEDPSLFEPVAETIENRSSIIEHLLDEPDMIDRMDVVPRSLDETERKLFSYFSAIPGIGEQVSVAIADIHNNSGDRTSKSGNIIIVGRRGSGKTKLADSLVLAACKDLNITAVKTAKIIASDFNQKDAAAIVKKMAGGFLIIEGAGELAEDTVDKLNRAMEFRTDDMVVILEDEKQDMKALLERYPEFAAKFTSRITIPVFTNDELVTFGKLYAQENGYSFDELATLALYTMIGENQKNAEPVTVSMVREMIDKAIAKSKSRKFPLFGKNQVGADGRIILREKDFAF